MSQVPKYVFSSVRTSPCVIIAYGHVVSYLGTLYFNVRIMISMLNKLPDVEMNFEREGSRPTEVLWVRFCKRD